VLVGLTRNSYLSSLYADLAFGNMHFQLARDVTTEAIGLRTLVSQHDEMIEAMKARDCARLLACLSDHIKNLTRENVTP
jgi:DNA-binding GntR family transcriptional regulator